MTAAGSGLDPAPLGAPVRVIAQESSFSGIAFSVLLLFLFLAISRVLDYTVPRLHLPLILAVVAAAFTFISCGITIFSTTVGRLAGLFTLWFIICIPFSQWKGGSFNVLREDMSRSVLLFMMVGTAVTSLRKVQGVMSVLGCGIVVTMAIALVKNVRVDGRLTMSAGQFSNSNDLAQIILLGMCFLPVLGMWRSSKFLTIMSYLILLPMLYTVFLTGSRAGLLAAVVLAGLVFIAASVGKKLVFIVLLPALLGGLLVTSSSLRLRVATLFQPAGPVAEGSSEDMAISSTQSRMDTLKQSLMLTIRNPLFGVGPGVFQSAAADLEWEVGKRALWLETHNAYTQVSSEMGFPGGILFCGAVLASITGLLRVRKRAMMNPNFAPIQKTTEALLLGFLAFALTSVFSSVAYGFIFWTLFGLCGGAIATMQREMDESGLKVLQLGTLPGTAAMKAPSTTPTIETSNPSTKRGVRVTLSGRIKMRRGNASQLNSKV